MSADTAVVAYIRGLRLQRERAYARAYVTYWRDPRIPPVMDIPLVMEHGMSSTRGMTIANEIKRLLAAEVKA